VHEMSVIESLVEQVRAHVPASDVVAGMVKQVRIEVGSLEHLDDEIMQLGWQANVMDTELTGAELAIDHIAMVVRCGRCGKEYEPVEPACLFCPDCGCAQPIVLKGKGVMLT